MATESPFNQQRLASLSTEDRIDVICDAYEETWLTAGHGTLDEFLQFGSESERKTLFHELLLVDIECRGKSGTPISKQQYLRAYPNYAEQIETIELLYGDESADEQDTVTETETQRRIAQFELIEKVGFGAAGEVWKARDTRLQRIVAVKIPRSLQLTEAELHRFLREGRAVARLNHPHIVEIYEVGRDGDTIFIVSRFIHGETLRSRLNQVRPSGTQAAELCRQLAESLHHAHEQGVVHRDLKPSNILIDQTGQPFVADFGLAKWNDDGRDWTMDGQLVGTLAYMSPEQAAGKGLDADRRTDVYALGVLLYEMLTGKCPFEGDHAGLLQQIVHDTPRLPRVLERSVPRDLETICLKAMQKEASRRYPSAQEMAVDLARFLRGDPIHARRTGLVERSWRWVKKHKAIAAAVLLALVTAGSLVMAKQLSNANRQLLGLQTVTLATEPPGARIAFAPIDPSTGEPDVGKVIRAAGQSPVTVELPAGEYFVVAQLPDGRFHEVYRFVPTTNQELFEDLPRNLRPKIISTGNVELFNIRIPEKSITADMAYVAPSHSSITNQLAALLLTAGFTWMCRSFLFANGAGYSITIPQSTIFTKADFMFAT